MWICRRNTWRDGRSTGPRSPPPMTVPKTLHCLSRTFRFKEISLARVVCMSLVLRELWWRSGLAYQLRLVRPLFTTMMHAKWRWDWMRVLWFLRWLVTMCFSSWTIFVMLVDYVSGTYVGRFLTLKMGLYVNVWILLYKYFHFVRFVWWHWLKLKMLHLEKHVTSSY